MKKRIQKKNAFHLLYKGLSPVKCSSCGRPIQKKQLSSKSTDGIYTCDICRLMKHTGFNKF